MISTVLLWWSLITLIGLAALPCTVILFRRLPDSGYTLARPFGLLLSSYILWLGASAQVIPNNSAGIALVLVITIGISALAIWKSGGLKAFFSRLTQRVSLIITTEVLFALFFIGWCAVRAYTVPFRINPTGGEKFMEIAFLNGVLGSSVFPPLDPWLSGFGISYYYFGFVMMGLLTSLSGLPSEVAFDLYNALLFALTASTAFGLVYNLITAGNSRPRILSAAAWSLLGAVFTSVMGNLLGLIELLQARGWLVPDFLRWLAVPDLQTAAVTGSFLPAGDFWWWRSSRILNDLDLFGKPIGTNPITEFPFFSFLLGDNHPHVLALPFVLLSIHIAFQIYLTSSQDSRLSPVQFITVCLTIGSLAFLNTWDYPIYLSLAVLAWLAGTIQRTGVWERRHIWHALRIFVVLLSGTLLAYLFFFAGFSSQAGGFLPYIYPPTRLVQYFIMFGPFIVILSLFLVTAQRAQGTTPDNPHPLRRTVRWWLRLVAIMMVGYASLLILAGLVLAVDQSNGGSLALQVGAWLGGLAWWEVVLRIISYRLINPWVFLLLTGLLTLSASALWSSLIRPAAEPDSAAQRPSHPSIVFVLLLILIGLSLTFVVEFGYLRDNFGVRMNTVFKFYYQGWVCLSTASAYALWWMASNGKKIVTRLTWNLWSFGAAAVIVASLVYPAFGAWTRAGGFKGQAILDGSSILRKNYPDDFAAIDWLRLNVPPGTTILEAPGRSYDFEGRVSAFTGLPTVLGWAYHEAQWRGSYTEQSLREADLAKIFSDPDSPQTRTLLEKWQVKYIILGAPEVKYVTNLCAQPETNCLAQRSLAEFESAFRLVFHQGSIKIYTVQ